MSTRTAISSDRVEVEVGHREFGGEETPLSQFQSECPETLRVLTAELKRQSALHALAEHGSTLTKDQVYDAYALDLGLLQGHVNGFKECARQAVRCSTILVSDDPAASQQQLDKARDDISNEILHLDQQRPLLALPNTLASQDADAILRDLEAQFDESLQYILRLFTCWLHALSEAEVVGLVEWNDVDVARYHFFHRVLVEDTLQEKRHEERDASRREARQIHERTVHRQRFFERHVHHVVNARLQSLAEYPHPLPSRAVRFLASVPPWLKPMLQVVDGQMTMEEVLRHKIGEETVVERHVSAVYKYDPALCLGDFTLLGWTADEAQSDAAQKRSESRLFNIFMVALLLSALYGAGRIIYDTGYWVGHWIGLW